MSEPRVLVLSVVHPDFLPPVYAIAGVCRDHGLAVDIFSFATPTGEPLDPGPRVRLHDCGSQGVGLLGRIAARRRFRARVDAWMDAHDPRAIVATCPFSYLEALRVARGRTPVVYLVLEMYEVSAAAAVEAPATALRSWRALHRLDEAALVCVPSPERAGWLTARAGLSRLPTTVLNAPSRREWRLARVAHEAAGASVPELPERFRLRTRVIATGGVSPTQAVLELVQSVESWPRDAVLVVTNVGDSDYARQVRSAAERSARRDDILLLPTLSRARMRALQMSAHIGVCLLRTGRALETVMPAPNKIGEYVHAGLLVVGVRMPYLDRLAQHEIAVLADDLSSAAIARAMTSAVERVSTSDVRQRILRVGEQWYCMEEQARSILTFLGAASGPQDGGAAANARCAEARPARTPVVVQDEVAT